MVDYSVREAKANFAAATTAAASGERVVITKNGKPFVELVPVRKGNVDWDKLAKARAKFNLDLDDYAWPDEFNDPAFSRRSLGMED